MRAPWSTPAGVIALLLASAPANAFDQRYLELLRLALACPETPMVRKDGGDTITTSTAYSFIDEGRSFSIVTDKVYAVTGVKSKIVKETAISAGLYGHIDLAIADGAEFEIKCKDEADCITYKLTSTCTYKDCVEGEVFDISGKIDGAATVLCDEESAQNAKAAFELLMRERR